MYVFPGVIIRIQKKKKKNAQLCFFAETNGSRARLATFVKLCAEILAAASDGVLNIEDITGVSVLQVNLCFVGELIHSLLL